MWKDSICQRLKQWTQRCCQIIFIKNIIVFRTLLLLADVRCRLVKVQLKAEINQSLFVLISILEWNHLAIL